MQAAGVSSPGTVQHARGSRAHDRSEFFEVGDQAAVRARLRARHTGEALCRCRRGRLGVQRFPLPGAGAQYLLLTYTRLQQKQRKTRRASIWRRNPRLEGRLSPGHGGRGRLITAGPAHPAGGRATTGTPTGYSVSCMRSEILGSPKHDWEAIVLLECRPALAEAGIDPGGPACEHGEIKFLRYGARIVTMTSLLPGLADQPSSTISRIRRARRSSRTSAARPAVARDAGDKQHQNITSIFITVHRWRQQRNYARIRACE